MATEKGLTRRQFTCVLGAWPLTTARAQHGRVLTAAWAQGDGHRVGQLRLTPQGLTELQSLPLPSRPHGLALTPDGHVLVAARRPGEWLLRWNPAPGTSSAAQWHWVQDDRRLNGHVLQDPNRQTVLTTETDQASASGRIGLRHPTSLEKTGEWSTLGMDPHEMLVLPEAVGHIPAGSLIVANGGIELHSETGRSKRGLANMDPSLVALSMQTGEPLGQWRLPDPRLSVRHLAWNPVSRRVGIALQAEHDDEAPRDSAPLLAWWDGAGLSAAASQASLAGYGGDVCALSTGGFCVSATRAGVLVFYNAQGAVVNTQPLASAGALAAQGSHWWAAGAAHGLSNEATDQPSQAFNHSFRLDNHWLV
jgi:hypothetical protein